MHVFISCLSVRPSNVDVEAQVTLAFDVCLQVSHFKVIINPVDNEVWEPRVFSSSLKEFVEELEALLSKVVTEDLEAHQGLILAQSLGKQSKAKVVYLIVSHVQVDQTFIYCSCLSDCLGAIV
jgi:hypothetical protein